AQPAQREGARRSATDFCGSPGHSRGTSPVRLVHRNRHRRARGWRVSIPLLRREAPRRKHVCAFQCTRCNPRTHRMTTANARFTIKSWDEKPYSEGAELPKLTRASVVKNFTGDIDGEGHVEYLMMYRSDGSAAFVGLERITGRIGDRSGSF